MAERGPGLPSGAGLSRRRLRGLLVLLFLALSVPAAALVWLGFRQLDLETFRQQQIVAEGLAAAIDGRLAAAVAREQQRPAAAYVFAGSGPPAARSPLSTLPVASDVPGAIGYFQVDAAGELSSPVLPEDPSAARYGLDDANELAERRAIAATLRAVLVDNRLVGPRPAGAAAGSANAVDLSRAEETVEADAPARDEGVRAFLRESAPDPARGDAGAQAAFDRLASASGSAAAAVPSAAGQTRAAPVPVADAIDSGMPAVEAAPPDGAGVLPDAVVPAAAAKVSAFGVELEPFVFRRLDTGHFVLFRNAWRNGMRLVQGLVIDDSRFLAEAIAEPFAAAAFAPGVVLSVDAGGETVLPAPDTERALRPLLRTRLSPPLADIRLTFSAGRLPASPVRNLLVWSAVALFTVIVGGVYAMYRFGVGQIDLARQQRTFVSAVSHELKTPLTSIRMYGEMLRAGWASDAKKREYYEFIHAESERLSRLIDNVLALARIGRGGRPALEPVTVGELLDMVRSKVGAAVSQAGFALRIEADAATAARTVDVDPDAIAQIFINLVDNALKFAAAAATREVVLSAQATDDKHVVVGVRDYGPGIGEQDRQRLFELFYRPDDARTRATAGTGIGLALVRQLAAQMNGRVEARNANPGALFALTLPSRQPAGASRA